jgi:hypothetical protein
MSIKEHIKIQLEVFLTSVHFRLLNQNTSSLNTSIVPAKEELILESLIEFCREPLLMHDLYTNYDCDVQCTNLYDTIITILSQRSVMDLSSEFFPTAFNREGNPMNTSTTATSPTTSGKYTYPGVRLSILHRLAFEGLYAILHSMTTKLNDLVQTDAFDSDNIEHKDSIEVEIDKWCETQSDADYLLAEEEEPDVVNYSPSKDEMDISNKSNTSNKEPSSVKAFPADPWYRVSTKGTEQTSITGSESDVSESNNNYNPSLIDRENEVTTAQSEKANSNAEVFYFNINFVCLILCPLGSSQAKDDEAAVKRNY